MFLHSKAEVMAVTRPLHAALGEKIDHLDGDSDDLNNLPLSLQAVSSRGNREASGGDY